MREKHKKGKKQQKSIRFTIPEYSELLDEFPGSKDAILYAISCQRSGNIYIQIMSLHELQKKLGEEVVPHGLIEYIKSKREDDKLRSKTKPKANLPCNEKFTGDSQPNSEQLNLSTLPAIDTEASTPVNEESGVPDTGNQTQKTLVEDVGSSPEQLVSSEEETLPESTEPPSAIITAEWRGIDATAVGRSHLRSNPRVPCQDAAKAVSEPRPAIFVADGAGSASLSHFGSQAVVQELYHFTTSKESIHQEMLDQEQTISSEDGKEYAYRFINHAIATLKDISRQKKCPVDALKCTLLMTILGKFHLLWLKVGDGFIVVEKDNKLELISSLGKGEFANQTTFLSEHLKDKAIHYGFLPTHNVTGVVVFTDGAGETLISTDGSRIAGALSNFLEQTRTDKFDSGTLRGFLEHEQVWAPPKGADDRGVALLARLL